MPDLFQDFWLDFAQNNPVAEGIAALDDFFRAVGIQGDFASDRISTSSSVTAGIDCRTRDPALEQACIDFRDNPVFEAVPTFPQETPVSLPLPEEVAMPPTFQASMDVEKSVLEGIIMGIFDVFSDIGSGILSIGEFALGQILPPVVQNLITGTVQRLTGQGVPAAQAMAAVQLIDPAIIQRAAQQVESGSMMAETAAEILAGIAVGAGTGVLRGGLPGAIVGGVMGGGTALVTSGLGSMIQRATTTTTTGNRLPAVIPVNDPRTGRPVDYVRRGRAVLYNSDFASAKRVQRIAARARRRVGRRSAPRGAELCGTCFAGKSACKCAH